MQRGPNDIADIADMVEAELQAEKEQVEGSGSEPPISDLARVPEVELERVPHPAKVPSLRPTVAKEEVATKKVDPRSETDEEEPPTRRGPDLNAPTMPPPPDYEPTKLPDLPDVRRGESKPPGVE